MSRQLPVVLGFLALVCASAGAQSAETAYEFSQRLSPETRGVLTRIADSARGAKLPTDPLIAKAAEGVLKGADEARIITAVRSLVRQLGQARALLPPDVASGTLSAAASALRAGVPPETLRDLVRAGDASTEANIGVALITLADLATSGVHPQRASDAIGHLLRRRAPGAEMAAFRAAIAEDIRAGAVPDAALATRVQALVRMLDSRAGTMPPAGAGSPRIP